MMDIYFSPNYGKLYEKAENGKAVCWSYDGPEGSVAHQFICRGIPVDTGDEGWYDLVTPYGYGGPVIERVNEGFSREALTAAFEEAFSEYCRENRIVSEFVRFHILENNALDFADVYQIQKIRQTVGTNLKDYADPVAEEFSKSCRKTIRQALNKGVSYRVTICPDTLERFQTVYYATMDRNEAGEYYYFDDAYFSDLQKYFHEQLMLVEAIYEEKTIAAGLYFASGKTIHVHLSGTLTEYLHLSPAYVLKYATAVWGKEHGFDTIHYGGGRSNAEDDALFVFKKKFGQNTLFNFYIGKKIWNEQMYDQLCSQLGKNSNAAFFPAYRG